MNIIYNLIMFQILGGVIWFTFYIGYMLMNPKERVKFEYIVNETGFQGKKRQQLKYRLITFAFFYLCLFWEVSAFNTIKKSYKHWLVK